MLLITYEISFESMSVDWLSSYVIVNTVTIKAFIRFHTLYLSLRRASKHRVFTSGEIYCVKEKWESPLMMNQLPNGIENLCFAQRSTNGNPVKIVGKFCRLLFRQFFFYFPSFLSAAEVNTTIEHRPVIYTYTYIHISNVCENSLLAR